MDLLLEGGGGGGGGDTFCGGGTESASGLCPGGHFLGGTKSAMTPGVFGCEIYYYNRDDQRVQRNY